MKVKFIIETDSLRKPELVIDNISNYIMNICGGLWIERIVGKDDVNIENTFRIGKSNVSPPRDMTVDEWKKKGDNLK